MTRTTIPAILADRDAVRCLRSLATLVEAGDRLPFERRPPVRGMLGALNALHWAVESAGIWKFLAEDGGSAFHECIAWCREIGAERAVKYLEAVAALQARGRVPRDAARRYALVERIERQSVRTGEPDALRVLDKKYRGATDDMARKARAWARRHAADIEPVIPSDRERGRNDAVALSASEAALEQIKRMAAARDAARGSQQPRQRASSRRPAPNGVSGAEQPEASADPRIVRFYDTLRGVTKKQWVTIAARSLAKPRRSDAAHERIWEAFCDAVRGDYMPPDDWKRRVDSAHGVRRTADGVFAQLPELVQNDGARIRLRYVAERAARGVYFVLLLHDLIAEQKTAMQAARILLEPCDGIVTVL